MAKLPAATQKAVKKAEDGYDPIPASMYRAEITAVDPKGKGPAGPFWKVEFTITEGKYKGRKQFSNYSHSEQSAFKLKQLFDAIDLELDSDHSELVGEAVVIALSEDVIGAGPRKGQPSNNVDRVFSPDEDTDDDEDEDDEEEEEAPKKKSKGKAKPAPKSKSKKSKKDDDEEDDEEEEEEDDDADEDEEEEKPAAKKKGKAKKKKKSDDDDEEFEF